jgi:hypothetical protein
VAGPVKFAPGVLVKGNVTITNPSPEPATLTAGEYVDISVDLGVGAAVPA